MNVEKYEIIRAEKSSKDGAVNRRIIICPIYAILTGETVGARGGGEEGEEGCTSVRA